jgi:hypothetical protein
MPTSKVLEKRIETHKVFENLHRADPQARIAAIRKGIPAAMINELSAMMGISKEFLLGSLGLSRAAISQGEARDSIIEGRIRACAGHGLLDRKSPDHGGRVRRSNRV